MMYYVSKKTLATFDFNKHLAMNKLSQVASSITGKNLPCFSYFAIISLA